jgi:hypothetical protein
VPARLRIDASIVRRRASSARESRNAATVVATDPESDYWFWDFLVAGDPTFGIICRAICRTSGASSRINA